MLYISLKIKNFKYNNIINRQRNNLNKFMYYVIFNRTIW